MESNVIKNSISRIPINKFEIMDVTLRDGCYVTSFAAEEAIKISNNIANSGPYFIEVGYFNFGNNIKPYSEYCDSKYLSKIAEQNPHAKLAVMVKYSDATFSNIKNLSKEKISLVRFPCLLNNIKSIEPSIKSAKDNGLQVSVNVIRISERSVDEIIDFGVQAQECGADILYLADSNGSMFPSNVGNIMRTLKKNLSIKLGFHAHDGLSMSFINSLAAIKNGATLVDGSLGGIGKGGNLPLELISIYHNIYVNNVFNIDKLIKVIDQYIVRRIGNNCLLRVENAAASILNLNLDNLLDIKNNLVHEGMLEHLVSLINYQSNVVYDRFVS